MFSRRERDYLTLLVHCEREGDRAQRELLAAFPNPTYRRKLLWGIRRKAADAAADWELYAHAARVDPKVLPGPLPSKPVPLAADPLVTELRRVQGLQSPPRRSVRPGSSPPDRAPRKEGRT
jgi:hypothetical protein